MKNLFLSLIAAFAVTVSSVNVAQAQVSDMVSSDNFTTDTVTNTGTAYLSLKLTGYYTVSIQVNVTKISGTLGGTIVLQGSLDGTNYVTIPSSSSLTVTNVASQGYLWTYSNSPYLYYRVLATGTGTMSGIISAKIMYRKP